MSFKYWMILIAMFFPSFIGENAQLSKLGLLAIVGGCFSSRKFIGRGNLVLIALGIGVLLIGYVSTLHANRFLAGLVGGNDRVEGLMTMVVVFVVGWFACCQECESLKKWIFLFFIGCVYIWELGGWNGFEIFISQRQGIGVLMAMILPFLAIDNIERIYESGSGSFLRWIIWGFGLYLLIASGCRSAFLGFISAMVLMGFLTGHRKVLIQSMAVGLIACFLVPQMRHKLMSISFSGIGSGARLTLLKQFWACHKSLLGYGLEQQLYIINPEFRGFQEAVYDRFHCWPVDVCVSVGWLGLGLCLAGVYLVFRCVWANRKRMCVLGFGAGLLAFLVSALFNPPSMQSMLIASMLTGGIVAFSEPEQIVPRWFKISEAVLRVICWVVAAVAWVSLFYSIERYGLLVASP